MYTAEDTASLKVLQGSRRSVWATQHAKTCDHRQPTFSTCMVGRTQPVARPPYCLASLSIGRATKRDGKCGLYYVGPGRGVGVHQHHFGMRANKPSEFSTRLLIHIQSQMDSPAPKITAICGFSVQELRVHQIPSHRCNYTDSNKRTSR
jgi:hypothetical protein